MPLGLYIEGFDPRFKNLKYKELRTLSNFQLSYVSEAPRIGGLGAWMTLSFFYSRLIDHTLVGSPRVIKMNNYSATRHQRQKTR